MTIELQEPGVFIALCDGCGAWEALDIAAEADEREQAAALRALGWKHHAPEHQRFPSYGGSGASTIVYPQDFCPECEADEPRLQEKPRPRRDYLLTMALLALDLR